ncbi:hypothetical protein EV44_g3479 [Erysiphe necator]|uniref:Uncharacterized protein n=1 Tax=Uncinula necator TaxID=52586 RepID=A0A0B1PBU0_UNCNE|nr:hypothetical protein EV44_g3479 [Erysiphe necator]
MKASFLLKENTEVIATCQRRERAWHACLKFYKFVISNIDSTLTLLVDAIEKEKAVAFKAYIRLAIANFAASDSASTLPRIYSHSLLIKSNGSNSEKDKNIVKKVIINDLSVRTKESMSHAEGR